MKIKAATICSKIFHPSLFVQHIAGTLPFFSTAKQFETSFTYQNQFGALFRTNSLLTEI